MARPLVQSAGDELYASLLSTSHEGRGRTPRYRQSQLLFMHKYLQTNVDRIRTAIKRDTTTTESQVDVEVAMSLAVIRRLYDQIDFKETIKDEFRIAREENNLDARIPYGIVLLRPATHTRFFSIISAAAAALAAGNVVLLELENNLRSVDEFFRNDFKVYDGDAFAIAISRVEDTKFLENCLLVDQTTGDAVGSHVLKHHPDRVAVAVVDRTADLSLAARAIIKSKVAFQGTSSFAVDTVLVNEWIRKDFIAELENTLRTETLGTPRTTKSKSQESKASRERKEEILVDVNGVTVSEFPRSSRALGQKSTASRLHLVTVSGLVDATTLSLELAPLSVLYCFSNPHSAKYLGQYIDSPLCIANQVPTTLLVGPSLPEASTVADLSFRYEPSMLSKPAPQLIGNINLPLEHLYQKELKPLKPFKQRPGGDIGFFPRAILVGFFMVGLPSLCLLSYGAIRTGLYGYRSYLITHS